MPSQAFTVNAAVTTVSSAVACRLSGPRKWTHADLGMMSGPGGRAPRPVGQLIATCHFPHEYALANQVPHPRNVYLREDALTDPLDTWLASAFTPHRIEQTITALADAQPLNHPPVPTTAAQTIINECDAKLERYRAALDAGADPAVVTGWIAQTQTERARAEAELDANAGNSPRQMSRAEIRDLVTALGDIAAVLRDADPADKAKVYRQLGLRPTCQPEIQWT
ncbi:hypothetical protein Q2K19_22350 [Micromonospora soli]|uniref:hypothetical protein n=1 Tax=Micromonospora sp. NBRC 110009 TaxID=3061627 RepID=UPI0026724353|nr:hypothetical protein [Micromonospora sp. NBRC 110009]WKT96913.1 hypothetical protein Q2K19_22350 [Micromonospora sp. NBRC 110009]